MSSRRIDDLTELVAIIGAPARPMPTVRAYNGVFELSRIGLVCATFQASDAIGAVQAMRTLRFRGMAVTMPFKSAVLSAVDKMSSGVLRIGACNTLYWQGDCLVAENTDALGLAEILAALPAPASNRAVVLGSGGAARAAVSVLGDIGIEVVMCARNEQTREALARQFGNIVLVTDSVGDALRENADWIINATPIGWASEKTPIPADYLTHGHTVIDFVFDPAMTAFLRLAVARGCRIVTGIDLLVAQGTTQLELWSGKTVDEHVLRELLLEALDVGHRSI